MIRNLSLVNKDGLPEGNIKVSPYSHVYDKKEYGDYVQIVTGDSPEEVWVITLPDDQVILFDKVEETGIQYDTQTVWVKGEPEIRISGCGTLADVPNQGTMQFYLALMEKGLMPDKRAEIAQIRAAQQKIEEAKKAYLDLLLHLGGEEKEEGDYEDSHSWYEIPGIPLRFFL